MALSERLLDYAIWRRPPSFFSLNLRALASEHRPVHADPADLKRFQEVQRVTADEQFGGWTQARISAQAVCWSSCRAKIGPLQ
jgi:hypothetical protein